ncbi:hypothetical protein GCM10018980_71870 [Streptomyces capoamus]|uniref:Uncharacterized protein n=1 Tax=Streptomyces capoamus TaxID=68183 RepID=A0A919F3B5_9ACTN|nr:hypothetical protein GCM10010501_16510 [Streptomyces libani subsp. rufus]GHG74786.1 hypothetical protein GCM10018980_71870 [Streptomyces capoamus]
MPWTRQRSRATRGQHRGAGDFRPDSAAGLRRRDAAAPADAQPAERAPIPGRSRTAHRGVLRRRGRGRAHRRETGYEGEKGGAGANARRELGDIDVPPSSAAHFGTPRPGLIGYATRMV